MSKIPHVFMQTTKKDPVDDYILNNIHLQLDNTWTYEHYNDESIINFFKMNPIEDMPDIINKFYSFKNGAHRADLFRYYYLYVKGGFYLDSDAMVYHNMNDIIKNYEFVSVYSCMKGFIFNGILGAVPKHEIIKQALYNAYNTDPSVLENYYHYWCQDLYNIVKNTKIDNTIKIYKEYYINPDGDETVDDNNIVLFIHYPKSKMIPRGLVGRKYNWGTGNIMFTDASTIITTWGIGNYKHLDEFTVEAIWNGYFHIVVFNQSYTKYLSIRKNDLLLEQGSLI
jgi:hypothetical protein